jgi:hypothetical protein
LLRIVIDVIGGVLVYLDSVECSRFVFHGVSPYSHELWSW